MNFFYLLHHRYLLIKILILFFSYFGIAFAIPFFTLTTSSKSLEIPINTVGSVTYQVLNSSGVLANNMVYDVTYPHNTGISIDDTSTTCQKSLKANEACILKLRIIAGSTPNTFRLSPRVCTENGIICSVPDINDRTVIVITIPQPPPVIVPLTLNTDLVPSDQHLQFRALILQNSGSESVTLNDISVTECGNIQNQIEICNNNTNCTPPTGSIINCSTGTVLAPGNSCLIWFRSNDLASQPLGDLSGTVTVSIQSNPDNTLNKNTFTANYANNLYVGGVFNSAGSVSNTSRIAKWNGANWSALGTGIPNNGVNALAIYQGDLFIGGDFTNVDGDTNQDRIVRWDGITFNALSTGIDNNSVDALTVFNNTLILGGTFTNVANPNGDRVVSWNGTTFNTLSTGISNNGVRAATVYQDKLILGGNFTNAGGLINGDRVISWNGTSFSSMATGISNNIVNALTVLGSNLFVSGTFTNQYGATGDRILSWNGVTFSPLSLTTSPGAAVNALSTYAGNLILGGSFTNLGGATGDRVVSWDGTTYNNLATGIANGTVNTLAVAQTTLLFAAGTFTNPASRIAQWNGSIWSPLGTGLDNSVNALVVASSLALE